MTERIAVLGAGRGLGAAFTLAVAKANPSSELLLISRKEPPLKNLISQIGNRASVLKADFSKTPDRDTVLNSMREFQPNRILYFAAGGPYGPFQNLEMKDHRWAWEVTFAFAAEVLHFALKSTFEIRQAVFIGSAIAEDAADPGAASYSAAKHALRGLVRSVRAEKPHVDVRLYSPGYMDTDLLPAHAWPRQQGLAMDAGPVAEDLLSWIFMNDDTGFRIYKK